MIKVLMGSESDREIMQKSVGVFEKFNVEYEFIVISAHRDSEKLRNYLKENEDKTQVFIAGAGLSAHLPGVIASMTCKPVIGVPLYSKYTGGVDALYSIVQMPKGVPVSCVGIDNSVNAALQAIKIIALSNNKLQQKYKEFMKNGCRV
ncbi:MAG: 5-(carboxyamino)imidazole ribonucleotide mutase [Candidatus Muirbacterium halophilum]|nr:5-(carboxyamino)imidazole ribonucleotide mutase [Candidatus Muirbacterium halophilum]MCK9474935.1 5-(carboxyamino)imidazole ribonucleotide mutase [Candidatus Muirbacterium halophilum]